MTKGKVKKLATILAGRVTNDFFGGDDFILYGAENENSDKLKYAPLPGAIYNKYYKEFKQIINEHLKN